MQRAHRQVSIAILAICNIDCSERAVHAPAAGNEGEFIYYNMLSLGMTDITYIYKHSVQVSGTMSSGL